MHAKHKLSKPWTLALVAGEVVSAVLAWRDLDRRSEAQVRGGRKAWRAFILMNPGNSLLYWPLARR